MQPLNFSGSTDDLKSIVQLLHVDGHWTHEGPFDLFRLESGESINFWPTSGEIRVNGHPGSARDLTERLQALISSASTT